MMRTVKRKEKKRKVLIRPAAKIKGINKKEATNPPGSEKSGPFRNAICTISGFSLPAIKHYTSILIKRARIHSLFCCGLLYCP